MTAKEIYLDILNNIKDINPKIYNTLKYLRPYYVYRTIAKNRDEAIQEIDSRHNDEMSFKDYYEDFGNGLPKFNDYEDKRDFFVLLGKHILDKILSHNPNFKDDYDYFIKKVEEIPKDKEYHQIKGIFDKIMYQVVYKCAEKNYLYWGNMIYPVEIYKYLMNKAVEEIREYKKNNNIINVSKK